MIKKRAQKALRVLKAPKASKVIMSLKAIKPTREVLSQKPVVSNVGMVRVTPPAVYDDYPKDKKCNYSVYKKQMKLAESIVFRYSDVFQELAK